MTLQTYNERPSHQTTNHPPQSMQLGTADPIESGGAGIEAVVGQAFSGVSAQSAPPMNSA